MTRKRHIVIVDDEANIGRSLRLILEGEGHRVSVFESASAFAANVNRAAADVYLLDVRLPDGNGIDLLRMLRQSDERAVAVMISGHGTIADAVEATKTGAFDFLEKPLGRDRVLLVVKNALEWSDLQRENQRYRELVGDAPRMIGSAPVFQAVIRQAGQVARSDVAVLLTGESGTGKELLAAYIHRESPFGGGPFVKVNCAAIPTELIESELFGHEKGAFTGAAALRRGKFELADGGTIFLDEVGDLHEASQAKLLRVLQDGELQRVGGEQTIRVAARVVSATNRRLDELVAAGRFREDLYYRLSVVPIRVPPLRERAQDIADLVRYFLSEFCARNNFRARAIDPDAIALLEQHPWPGNVRELRNVVERMAILSTSDRIGVDAVPLEVSAGPPARPSAGLQEVRDSAERERIRQALQQTDWNVSAAARLLDTERTALHKRIRTLGLRRQ
jgi:two-component system, NtrC family, nitrogen regulation response regulator NtrX